MRKPQLHYINNLKSFLILFVVAHHSAASYTIGENWPIINPERVSYLKPMLSINSAFFMGFFFLISALFVPASFKRYGAKAFLKSKVIRLLVPTVFAVLVVLPLAFFAQASSLSFLNFYIDYFRTGQFDLGHMWFLVQLFVYCSLFALIATVSSEHRFEKKNRQLTMTNVIGFIVILSVATYLIATVSPKNQWYGLHVIEPYHFPQYLGLFFAGILAYKFNWLEQMSNRFGIVWLIIGLFAALSLVMTWYFSVTIPLWLIVIRESFICVGLSIGLLIAFRMYFNVTNSPLQFLSDNSYAVYIFHIPMVMWMNRLLLSVDMEPTIKFIITTIVTYILTNVFCAIIRQSHLVRRVI